MEYPFYRETLEGVLAHSGGKHMLTMDEVRSYTGLKEHRTIKRHFPYFVGGIISAENLARCLCAPPPKRTKKASGRC